MARDRFLASIRRRNADRPPVATLTSALTNEVIESLGLTWRRVHTDEGSMSRVAVATATTLGLESVRVPFDQCVEAEALGSVLTFERRYPQPKTFACETLNDLDTHHLTGRGRTPRVVSAVGEVKRLIGEELPVLAGVTGPFTILNYLMGPVGLLTLIRKNPERVLTRSEGLGEEVARYANEMASAGADLVVIEEMAASPDVLNPSLFRSCVAGPLVRMISVIDVPCALHICGNVSGILGSLPSLGAKVFHVDPKTDLRLAREALPEICLAGGVDTIQLLQGRPEEVSSASLSCVSLGVEIVAPSCALHPATPARNIRAMVEAVKGYGIT